jgi:hypothetical protein
MALAVAIALCIIWFLVARMTLGVPVDPDVVREKELRPCNHNLQNWMARPSKDSLFNSGNSAEE